MWIERSKMVKAESATCLPSVSPDLPLNTAGNKFEKLNMVFLEWRRTSLAQVLYNDKRATEFSILWTARLSLKIIELSLNS